jgi:RNase H-fold protein (predicted Holliday junction resolvase)
MTLLAIDPGTAKCGIAIVERDTPPKTLHREIVPTGQVIGRVIDLIGLYGVSTVLIGNATGGKALARTARETLPPEIPLHAVPETRTSERARARYHRENPPTGWHRFLPTGCRTPPEPYDDYAAVILAEDWLRLHSEKIED